MADASGISDIKSLEEGRPSSFVGRNKKAIVVVVATIVVLAVVAGTAAGVTVSKVSVCVCAAPYSPHGGYQAAKTARHLYQDGSYRTAARASCCSPAAPASMFRVLSCRPAWAGDGGSASRIPPLTALLHCCAAQQRQLQQQHPILALAVQPSARAGP
jgi:hypothetical protein